MKVAGLDFSYGSYRVFDHFEFESQAPTVVICGPTGCGKSTLLKLFTANLKPTSVLRQTDYRRKVLVLQEDGLFPWLNGLDNISRILRISHSDIRSHTLFALIEPFCEKKAYQLSFGQRRTIELIRAFIYEADLLCLDEPLNFLDFRTREIIISYLREREPADQQVMITTHYTDELIPLNAEIYYFPGTLPISSLTKSPPHLAPNHI